MRRVLLGVIVALVLGAGGVSPASAAPAGPPPCSPPTFDGRLPASVESSPSTAIWMDPVVAPGDPVADQATALRSTGLPRFGTGSGAVLTFRLPIAVDAASLAFGGRVFSLTASGSSATWAIPADLSGSGAALLGTTVRGRPGPSYSMSLLVLPPGVPPPAGPGPSIPRCNPPPAAVCAAARAGSPLARACAVRVPSVAGTDFPAALERLRAAGLLVAVPRFPPFTQALPEQGWNRLETYVVGGQRPAAGTRTTRGSVVRLTIEPPRFTGPLASLALPNVFPPTFTAPNLVGLTDRAALAVAAEPSSAFWLKLDGAPALHASASRCGEDAFVVASQEPPAGTTMPSYGVVAGQTGVRPPLSTITLTLTTRCGG